MRVWCACSVRFFFGADDAFGVFGTIFQELVWETQIFPWDGGPENSKCPRKWAAVWDGAHSRHYYFHKVTHESLWDKPF